MLVNGFGMSLRGRIGARLTVAISTERSMAQIITNIPPLNRIINPTFLAGLRVDCQSMGMGIEIRYKSVETLHERKVQIT